MPQTNKILNSMGFLAQFALYQKLQCNINTQLHPPLRFTFKKVYVRLAKVNNSAISVPFLMIGTTRSNVCRGNKNSIG